MTPQEESKQVVQDYQNEVEAAALDIYGMRYDLLTERAQRNLRLMAKEGILGDIWERTEPWQQEKYIAWSTVDGTLDVISVHARPFFVIYEHGTKTRVRCAFPDDWTEKVLKLLGHRVAIDGLVYYKQSGEPYQLSKPTSIEPVPQPQSDILSLRGAIKGMTGDLSTYDYVRKIRDKNSFD